MFKFNVSKTKNDQILFKVGPNIKEETGRRKGKIIALKDE